MSLGNQFQTIVYYEDTGDIRGIFPNQYIKSRKSLNSLLGLQESRGIKFFYIRGYFPLRKEEFKVELGSNNRCPRLVSLCGKDAMLILKQQEAIYILETNKGIEYKFEGGMGDYIDQANVVIQMHKNYPNKMFWALVEHENRKKAIEMLEGWEGIEWGAKLLSNTRKLGRVDMSDITKMHKWTTVGKIGVYSAIGGLEKTAPRARICVTPAEIKEAEETLQEHTKTKNPYIVILHTVSGPANTKSIPPGAVTGILSPLFANKNIIAVHIGGADETIVDHPQIISLQGKLPWEKVLAMMSIAQACICIDSAIMHIAQHLPIPVISFWGPTNPSDIIGEDPGIITIRSTADCIGCNLWECSKTNCMTQFDPKEVKRAFKLLEEQK